ncbi:MAG: tetratricopeptide repeat protein [Saprospiraceae bacterium]
MAAIAIFGFLLYANTLGHDYVLDDFSQIKENFITQRGIKGIPEQFAHHARYGYGRDVGELYRPLTMTIFSLEWEIAPDKPAFAHFINVLLYALSGALLFFVLAKIMAGYNVLLPLLTTLFFVAHPVHSEVVANIKSLDEILMFGLCLLAIHFLWNYLKQDSLGWLAASLLCYLAALFSKENAVTFLAIFPLTLFFFTKTKWQKIAVLTSAYAVLALIFVLVRKAVIGGMGTPGGISVLDNFLAGATDAGVKSASAFLMLGKYLLVLLFPIQLVSDLGYNQEPLAGWGDWRVLLSFLAWAALGVFALLRFTKKDLWSYGILFFLINFSIFTNLIIMIGTNYGERLLYSASPGFALALALLLLKIFKGNQTEKITDGSRLFQNKALWGTAALILLFYSFKTITRNADWKTSFSLYEADIEKAPNSAKLNFHYGLELTKKGLDATDPAEKQRWAALGQQHFEKAIAIYPQYHDAYGQLGLCYYRAKNPEKALENYNLALKYRPDFAVVYSNMGIIFFEAGDLPKARELYEKAVSLNPNLVDPLRNLGAVNAMQKNFSEAIKYFKMAYELAPTDPVINRYLGSAYRDAGQAEQGKPYLDRAEQLEKKAK